MPSWTAGVGKLLVLSQVILSLALSFAIIPLVHFTSTPSRMGKFVSSWWVRILGVVISVIVAGLNGYLVVTSIINGDFTTAGPA
jgi:manganese transport protein